MHLRAIKLRGFKSFPDPVEVRLEPGVAVVVGPNGSGKSNIADALIWAAGSLAPSELRAEKPDDVLFAGSANRPKADHCEVELLFDNADGALPELEYAEVSIVRRLHRGGEGQYLVNGAHVRRTDVVELLADVGLGSAMGSIVSQGRVEAILASKPEDRRHLVEEAAGLGKFKRRKHRAELKLARVATQVERAKDVEDEVRKRLQAEEELSDAAGGREAAVGALYRLQGASERLSLRRESAAGLEERLRSEMAEPERAAADRSDEALARLEQASAVAAAAARDAAEAHGQASERARRAHARVAAYERRLAATAEARLSELRAVRGGVEAALAGATGGQEGANRRLVALGAARER